MKLSTNLHVERARHKMSQSELAQEVNMSRCAISDIENGKVEPKVGTAMKLAKFFKVTTEYLFNLKY